MKNNNNNIIALSNGYVYNATTKTIHPSYVKGGYDEKDSECIYDAMKNAEWMNRLTTNDYDAIIDASDMDVRFWLWYHDGNAIQVSEDVYATQCALWNNRIQGIEALRMYFLRSFYPQETLRYEVENSGEWVCIRDLYINCEDGRMADNGSLYYGDCFDTNIIDKEGVEYLEQMNAEELELLWKFFPRTIEEFKTMKIREYAEQIIPQTEDRVIHELVREIIALTK